MLKLKIQVLIVLRLVEFMHPPQGIRCARPTMIQTHHLRVHSYEFGDVVFDGVPLCLQQSLQPRSLWLIFLVMNCNPLPKNTYSLLITYNVVLRYMQDTSTKLFLFIPPKTPPLHTRSHRSSHLRHPLSLLLPSCHYDEKLSRGIRFLESKVFGVEKRSL
ncbi:hypothetical protein KC19_VG214300 [Ceratodon purpureus]|uniref:Secreted protein n=1 Tax=Ceratodon purpureus TaxID=3225 RepID=A0A8T0HTK1_CERPU|nr:hypothetical protein KC19_VG214300 [Ceratodon purpureus]